MACKDMLCKSETTRPPQKTRVTDPDQFCQSVYFFEATTFFVGESTNFFRTSNIQRMTTGDPGNGNGREVELLVRWKGAFQLGMFILGLFCVDVNVVGGNRGKVERGFSTCDVFWDCFVLM